MPVGENNNLLVNPHTAAVIGGVEQQLRQHGYHVLLRGIERQEDVAATVRGWSLDGAILVEFTDAQIDAIDIDDVPLVAIDSYSANPRTIGVRSDDHGGGEAAGRRLIQAGHRHLLFAGPPYEGMGVVGQRFDGFMSACSAAGIDPGSVEVVRALTTFEDGRELGLRLRRDYPDVTGLFATADVLAIGIIAGLGEAGSSVPGDVSIIGFDNLRVSSYSTPGLTTIAQDMSAKVAEAVRIVLDEIEGGEGPHAPVSLGVELVERGTVARPRA